MHLFQNVTMYLNKNRFKNKFLILTHVLLLNYIVFISVVIAKIKLKCNGWTGTYSGQ